MRNINSLLRRVNKITVNTDLKGFVVMLTKKDGKYFNKDGVEVTIPKKEDGTLYVILSDFSKSWNVPI